jgi:aquaporin Z
VGGWALEQLWLFIVAPFVGAILAAGVYSAIKVPTLTVREAEGALPSEQEERLKTKAAVK